VSRYESGSAFAAVAPEGAALLDDDTAPEVVERVWHALRSAGASDALGSALGILVEIHGVSALPSFAFAVQGESGARVVVRGGFEARIIGGARAGETVRPDGPTFWVERYAADSTGIVLSGPDGRGSPSLPVSDGVVRASSIVVGEQVEAPDESASPSASPVQRGDEGAGLGRPVPHEAETASTPADDPDVHVPEPAPVVVPTPQAPEPPVPAPRIETSTDSDHTLPPRDATFAVTAEPESAPSLAVDEGTTAYDDMIFGRTRAASVEGAAVRAPQPSEPTDAGRIDAIPAAGSAASAAVAPLGDHDGLTISAEQLQALRQRGPAAPAVTPAGEPTPEVVLVSTTGERAVLDRGAVVGVRPSVVRATGIVPHLIAVPSPSGEISRRHLEIRVEASHILAVDLDSTNGTRLLRVGAEPVRLHPGAATLLVAGDRLDLGDGVELSFEGLR